MDLEMAACTIQLIIAPAVTLTACCIFTNGLLGHYASIGERLRVIVYERVDLLRDTETAQRLSVIAGERLEDIDFQIPNLLRHHLLVRNSLAGTFIAMTFYILDMFVIAFSIIANHTGLFNAILGVFLLGVASQLAGALFSVVDAFLSHRIHVYDTRHAMLLEKHVMNHRH